MVVRLDDRYPEDDVRLLTGIEVGLGWAGRWVELRARGGIARGHAPSRARWGELRAACWIVPSAALFASVKSTTHMSDAVESVHGRRASIGIEFVPGGRSAPPGSEPERTTNGIAVEYLGKGAVRVVLSIRARAVEVSCDATGWLPVPAWPRAPGLWEVVLPLEPGLHRVAIRLDGGAWGAPPGLPKALDDFGGEIGLLVVP